MPDPVSLFQKAKRSNRFADILFLLMIGIISSVPFVSQLGFYYDDWVTLHPFPHQPVLSAVHEMLNNDSGMRVRPVQTVFTVLNVEAFGLHPLGYHIVIALLAAILSVCIYLTGIALRIPLILVLTITLIFGLLPHYSTDHFWFSSQQAVLCMIFAFLGICAFLRGLALQSRRNTMWLGISTILFALSLLTYEVAVGLIAAAVATALWKKWRALRNSGKPVRSMVRDLAGLLALLIFVFTVKAMHQSRVPLTRHSVTRLLEQMPVFIAHAFSQFVRFDFWTYGIRLPKILVGFYRQNALSPIAIISAIAISLLTAAYLWRKLRTEDIPDRRICLQMIALSIVLFFLGYALFFPYTSTDFTAAGIPNRIAIASALAPACLLPSGLALICSMLPGSKLQNGTFAVAIGVACGMNSLATSGIAHFWIDASIEQREILNSVVHNRSHIADGDTVLLDGFCRYRGPGIVFEAGWDTTAAIQLALDNFSVRSDVVSTDLRFSDTQVESLFQGEPTGEHYPYGSHLLVFNLKNASQTPLNSRADARAYLRSMNPTGDGKCPASTDEYGVKLF